MIWWRHLRRPRVRDPRDTCPDILGFVSSRILGNLWREIFSVTTENKIAFADQFDVVLDNWRKIENSRCKININCTFPAPAASCQKRERAQCSVLSVFSDYPQLFPRLIPSLASPRCKHTQVLQHAFKFKFQTCWEKSLKTDFVVFLKHIWVWESVGPCDIVCRDICDWQGDEASMCADHHLVTRVTIHLGPRVSSRGSHK